MRFTYIFVLIILISCETKTETFNSHFLKEYGGGKSIDVLREDSYSKTYGIISHKQYGEDHSFRYEFVLQPDDHKWIGSSRQIPKKILFCRDEILLLVTEQRTIIDTANLEAEPVLKDTVIYYQNNDKRFFFKLFGEQHFEPVDRSIYFERRSRGKEESIPLGE
jgi:hypothetical protein